MTYGYPGFKEWTAPKDFGTFPTGCQASIGPWDGPIYRTSKSYTDPSLPQVSLDQVLMDLGRSSTNLAEGIATIKDTINLFRGPGKFLKHLARSGSVNIKSSRAPLKELKSAFDKAGDTWLEGTYGWIPFIQDLIELSSIARNPQAALAKLSKPIVKDIRHTASSGGDVDSSQLEHTFVITERLETTRKRLIRIEASPSPSFQAMSMANKLATYLGLNDFGRLAWELVPYSFVVDWFTDLGSSVSSMGALNGPAAYIDGIVSMASWSTVKHEFSLISPQKLSYPSDSPVKMYWNLGVGGGSCVVEATSFFRSERGKGNLDGDLFHNGLSAYRTASGIALMHGALRGITGW